MKNLIVVSTVIVACFSMLLIADEKDQKNAGLSSDAMAVKEAVSAFSKALNQLDLEALAECYSEDVTVFYPFSFSPHRLNGREETLAMQRKGFEWARKNLPHPDKSKPLTLNITPADMNIQMLGDDAAVATWHSKSNFLNRVGRRTAVLHKVNGKWLIVSHHASNIATRN